ncbi:dual specificity protein phosphatase 3-like [Artemia franciscana]
MTCKYYVTSRLPWREISQASLQVEHLKTILEAGAIRRHEAYNEVYPGIVISDEATAMSSYVLRSLGITHVLNTAAHDYGLDPAIDQRYSYGAVRTSQSFYNHLSIKYFGIPAVDIVSYNLSRHFNEAAEFIDEALRKGGKILVHCQMGISRSATLVIAFLMIKKQLSVEEAIKTVRMKRFIYPNDGFLRQLCQLDERHRSARRRTRY